MKEDYPVIQGLFLTKQKNKILHKISNIGDFKRVGNVFWKGETHMDQISEKELAALNELLSEEELLIKKFKMLSEHTEDAEVKAKSEMNISDAFKRALPQDFVKFGLIPEFIGRVPITVSLDALDRNALIRILQEPKNSLIKQYTKLFELDGVGLEFKDDAVEAIADKALERKTGARGLRAIMEAVMLDLMYRIPSDETISKCVIDKALVEKNLALDGSEVPAIEKKDEEKDEELAS